MPIDWEKHPPLREPPQSPVVVSYTQLMAVKASDGTQLGVTPPGVIVYVIAQGFVALRVFETIGGIREALHPLRSRIIAEAIQIQGKFAPQQPPARVLVHDAANDNTVMYDDLTEDQRRAVAYCEAQGVPIEYFRLTRIT
jgi:hypothetical protein